MSANDAGKHQSLYKKREKIYTKVIGGKLQQYRIIVATVIYGCFFLIPWINYGERPAVFFDLSTRQFHIFAFNFWPQDFMYLAWLLIIAAFALFLFTTVAGRLWCGFACPQTIWTLAYIWVEEKIEGKPNARKQLDKSPWNINKIKKKLSKHILWLIMAFITGLTFVSYFYPVRTLVIDIVQFKASLSAWVWIGIFTYLTYLDAGWLREQVCIYMCPYARFQSVMYDKNTLLVAYNEKIGEPRASIKSHIDNSGSCIDCEMCVQVCPTGIDIRHGSQIACINCGLCLDACKDVMHSVSRPDNLITFTTLDMNEGKSLQLIRPKTIAYIAVLFVMCSLFLFNLLQRSGLEASIIRDRDNIYRQIDDTTIANDYLLKVANKTQGTQTYAIVLADKQLALLEDMTFTLNKGEAREITLTITHEKATVGSHEAVIHLMNTENNTIEKQLKTRFIYTP